MELYQSGFNPAQSYHQMPQQQQGGGLGGMLGQMIQGQDWNWKDRIGDIDTENIMPGLGMDMSSGMLGMAKMDASNPDILNYDIDALNAPEGAFGTQDAYSKSFNLTSPVDSRSSFGGGNFGLGNNNWNLGGL